MFLLNSQYKYLPSSLGYKLYDCGVQLIILVLSILNNLNMDWK